MVVEEEAMAEMVSMAMEEMVVSFRGPYIIHGKSSL